MLGSTSSGLLSRCGVVIGGVKPLGLVRLVSSGLPSFLVFTSVSLGFGCLGALSSRGHSSCLSGYITITIWARAFISSSSVMSGWKRFWKETFALLTLALSCADANAVAFFRVSSGNLSAYLDV